MDKNINKDLRKEIVKDYKKSMYLFSLIRDVELKKIDQPELPPDLTPTYCEYCMTICEMYGQIEI